jgi:hypothetical protein
VLDLDGDGHDEIWVHSDRCSVVVSPWRGGAVEELTLFGAGINYADVLTRRLEAYHVTALEQRDSAADAGGTPSIHDLEEGIRLTERPPVDAEERALFVDRVLPADLTADAYARGAYAPVRSWARSPAHFQIAEAGHGVEVRLSFRADGAPLLKSIRIAADGRLAVAYDWGAAPDGDADGAVFAPELSLFRPLALRFDPEPEVWAFPVETVAKSERGLDRTRQGESVTPRWPLRLGRARLELGPLEG